MRKTREDGVAATIMVVEDDPLNGKLFAEALALAGHRVLPFARAEDARRALASTRPDAVLLDIELPDGSGLEVAEEIRRGAETRDAPIIALTALAARADAERARASGCDEVVVKPVSIAALVAAVGRHLD